MGAKTKIEQAPTLTAEQKAFMDMVLKGSSDQMQGFIFGEGWGGPGSYAPGAGYGGKVWNPTGASVSGPAPTGAGVRSAPAPAAGMTTRALAGMAPIASAPGTAPVAPSGQANPFASYSDRDRLVDPLVNPFRRNIGG